MHKTVLSSGPAVEPVSLAEAKDHLNVTSSLKNDYITSLIVASRIAIERYLNRVLITQAWKVYYDSWCDDLRIPFGALQAVQSLKYYDIAGIQHTLSASDYYWVILSEDPGRIKKKFNIVWPILEYVRPDAIEIAFTAGFGDAAVNVPEPLRLGIKLMLTNYYANRDDVVIGPPHVNKIPSHVSDMIHSYRLYNF